MRGLKRTQLTPVELLLPDQLENRRTGNVEANELLVIPEAVDSSVFLVLANFDSIYRRRWLFQPS